MRILKLLLLLFAVVGVVISSCGSNTPAISQTDLTFAPTNILPTATFTFVPELTNTPAIVPTNTPTPIDSKTRVNLSPELYLDENSSPDNLRGEPYHLDRSRFSNTIKSEGNGWGFVYQLGKEEWVTALTWTRIFPFDDNLHPREGELRQHYVQVWKDGKMLNSFPVDDYGYGYGSESLLRYEDHWIFWFTNIDGNRGLIVQDGIVLNELHNYDNVFSLFLLDGKPFFFFQRGNQFGVSFNNQEILLPYSNISYGMVCCDGGGRNPRETNIMAGFYTQRENSEYQYIEIGLR